MPAYLQTWTEGVESARDAEGEALQWAGSNKYPAIGLEAGDRLFIAYLEDKRLHLIGRLVVAEVMDRPEALRKRRKDIWEATHYAYAKPTRADRYAFDLRVPDEIVRRLRFVRKTGEITNLRPSANGSLDGKALQAIRRLTPESEALLDAIRELEPEPAGPRRSNRPLKPERDAIEDRAMDLVTKNYRSRGWEVEDVSSLRSYDLVCKKDSSQHHVEVKGTTTGTAVAVELTRLEVTHAKTCKHHLVLAVVEHIHLRPGDPPVATKGDLRLYDPWRIDEGTLEPLRFSYELP